jgi:tetrahydromethanopterin S-methyltransferase subunit E
MNTKNLLVAAILTVAAGVSFAGPSDAINAGIGAQSNDASTVTRAQVRAEMLRARAQRAASGHHVSPEE